MATVSLKRNFTNIDEYMSWKHHIDTVKSAISKSLSILYKSTDVWANIVQNSYISPIYVIHHKDRHTHASPLLDGTRALSVDKLNIVNILRLMHKCKYNLNSPVFCNVFTHRTRSKYTLWNETSIHEPLCQTNFSQYCISYVEPIFEIQY